LKDKLSKKKQKLLEERKETSIEPETFKEEEKELEYPEECRVLDIMKEKYYDAIEFFSNSEKEEDKKQLAIAVREY
jgi:hypothetical protein